MRTDRAADRRRRRPTVTGVGARGLVVVLALAAAGCTTTQSPPIGGITVPPVDSTLPPTLGPAPATSAPAPTTTLSGSTPPATSAPPPSTTRPPCERYSEREDLPLGRCDRGELVERVQGELAAQLEIDLAVDGFFGDRTEAAVLAFQGEHDLEVDGLVGPATWNELFGSRLADDQSTQGISENWFGRSADAAVTSLQDRGFVVVAYEVCSSSVGPGEVRQIASGDGDVYVDQDGITDLGRALPIGAVIEVKIGNGTSC